MTGPGGAKLSLETSSEDRMKCGVQETGEVQQQDSDVRHKKVGKIKKTSEDSIS